MENFEILKRKLETFIRRYYLNELLKGAIFFVSIGLLYILTVLFIEYFLWLPQLWRSILFWGTILVELVLLLKFIIYPLLKLFRISGGIDYEDASKIIGSHFPEVSDKLLNVLQLKETNVYSELLLAGIDQKAAELKPVPFSLAIDLKKNLPYLKYAGIPVVIFLLVFFTGNSHVFTDSYERVVHYKVAYTPPAPFVFIVLNSDLRVREGENLKVQVGTQGRVVPETASIHFEGQEFFLSQVSPGMFEYNFDAPVNGTEFYLSANGLKSELFEIEVISVPRMTDFEMHLSYPAYTGLKSETKDGTGNAVIPEGTVVTWELGTRATNKVAMQFSDTVVEFDGKGNRFNWNRSVYNDMDYIITTSNEEINDYEKISYTIKVIKDAYPEIDLKDTLGTPDGLSRYFYGKVSDDYGLSRLQVVFYPTDDPDDLNRQNLPMENGTYGEFVFVFPDTLELEKGRSYSYYFEIFDNDGLRNSKSTKSRTFNFRKPTADEEQEQKLDEQKKALEGLDRSLGNLQLSQSELRELEKLQMEKRQLSYSDRKKVEDYLTRQKQQNDIMKSFTDKLNKTLEEREGDPSQDERKKQLKDLLERKEQKLEENEKLLQELEEYSRKLEKEALKEKLEELSRSRQNQERSLEQLLELTKRYYVEEKAARISRKLQELGSEQERLSHKEQKNTESVQDSLGDAFKGITQELRELQEENSDLRKPIDLGNDPGLEDEIRSEQQKALEKLHNNEKKDARENQKRAGEKMKKLGDLMEAERQIESKERMQEDAEMLRQILDNLLVFSFEQEDLMERFRSIGSNDPQFAAKLRRQNDLKENFGHIDDSIFALALRNPMVTEEITEKITDVEYDLEKSLERLSENEIEQGTGSQQYVITGANYLAYFLSHILDNMEDMMSKGGGQGDGMEKQLPDIIREQNELGEQMKDGLERKEDSERQGKDGGRGQEQFDERQDGELFEIFKKQQMLRKALEERLEKEGLHKQGGAVRKDMEELEEEILLNGFDQQTLRKMMELEHKLLELENATVEQGRKPERESRSSEAGFKNPVNNQIIRAKEYFNTTEILNRQTLPLRQIYKQKVKDYFERRDH